MKMSSEIRIDGVIGTSEGEISAAMVRSQLPADGSPIVVKIHSEGGSVFEGFAIYDAIKDYKGQKSAVVESSAFSIASFIAMAFDDVSITPNGYMMLHNPWVEVSGDDEELSKQSELLGQMKVAMVQAYATKTGKPEEEIAAILKRESFLNAEQSVAIGLANRITDKPMAGRVFAKMESMPHGVVAALFGAGSSGDQSEPTKEQSMSNAQPVAATLQEIKAAFPKAKAEFVVKCLEKSLPMASVAQAAVEEMMAENQELAAKCKAMEEELAKFKSMAPSTEEVVEQEESEEEMAKAPVARRTGANPVAKASGSSNVSARAQWTQLIGETVKETNGNRQKAVALVNRRHPGLREKMVQEANV